MSLALTLPNAVPILGGLSFSFTVQRPLVEAVKNVFQTDLRDSEYSQSQIYDPYIIRVKQEKEADEIIKTINDFCAPHIKNWWLDTQDKLVRKGTEIREELVQKIQEDIQNISNDLSNYLGKALQVEINLNPIQFPSFEFSGIDAQVKYQQGIYEKKQGTSTRTGEKQGFCEEDEKYKNRTTKLNFFHEINLHRTSEAIKLNIDNKASASRGLLQRVIEKQIAEDFRNAEHQINDYIKRFQDEFDRLLKERETKEIEADQIRETLNLQKEKLNEYLRELKLIRESLNTWNPL